MKNICSLVLISILVLFSCQKVEKSTQESQYQRDVAQNLIKMKNPEIVLSALTDYHQTLYLKEPQWWTKLKKWVKKHTGTHLFENCQGNNPCGPCPGICLEVDDAQIVNEGYELSSYDIQNGDYLFILHQFEEEQMVISFINTEHFIYHDYFYLPQDWNLGHEIAEAFDQDQIIIEAGAYPVFYDYYSGGETVVDVIN